jgi:hypothetical protein
MMSSWFWWLMRLVCVRHLTQRRQLIDDAGQVPGEFREQFLAWKAGLARKGMDRCRTEGLLELVRRDQLVLVQADPRLSDCAVATVDKAIEELAESFAMLLAAS